PQNLLLKGDVLKVADFGLARVVNHSVTGHTGHLTLAYAAPEFFDGKTARQSDQYSLAVAYCQLRGGQLPFSGSTAQIVAGHLSKSPDLSMLPEEERSAVRRALSKEPNERWPSCAAFVEALIPGSDQTIRFPGRRNRGLRVAVGLALLAVASVIFIVCLPREQGSVTPTTEPPIKVTQTPPREPERPVPKQPPIEETQRPPREPERPAPKTAFVFDGRSRIVSTVERFAPVTLEAWVRPEAVTGGRAERYIIGSDIAGRSGIG